MTTREEKINALQKINEGVPARFALSPEKYYRLYGKPDQDFYLTSDKEVISKEDQKKYLPEAIICINVSKQFADRL